jgi:glycosyltransferase involved in cell wall biosynthesis
MRILWSIHLYPPKHNCGAEYVAHHVNKYLLSQGHEVRVMLLQGSEGPYIFEGVEVVPYPRHNVLDAYNWADVVCTHLDFDRHTTNICGILKRPVFHFMHNDAVDFYKFIEEARMPQYMVYNSEWIAKEYSFNCASVVLYPPCPADYYRILGNPINSEYITLINTNENKGGYLLIKLAEAMPDRKFLAVNGSYDDGGLMPYINSRLKALPNVKFIEHSSNPREIYQQTRILLVLSRYESWGRVATEAMSNGIPVIYTPTKGLWENIGLNGVMMPSRGARITDKRTGQIVEHDGETYNVLEIKHYIELLDCEEAYLDLSVAGLERYKHLQMSENTQLYELHKLMQQAKQDYQDIRAASGNSSSAVKFN